MTVFKSYSKINLSLIVIKKLRDKLHEIQSLFCLINVNDKIEVIKIREKRDKILFKGPFAKDVSSSNNSINSLLKLLRKMKLISNFYSVVVTKNIPVFGGLGGGTSNAIYLLKFLLKGEINNSILSEVEKKIGSDTRLFFFKRGFLQNLKKIIRINKKYDLYFLLVHPNIKCSTSKIYSKIKKYSKKTNFNYDKIRTKSRFIDYTSNNRNDLQFIVEKKYPIIRKLLKDISFERGCYFSRMSGSGSVCYGLFNSSKTAKKALNKLKAKYPKFWLSVAKTV